MHAQAAVVGVPPRQHALALQRRGRAALDGLGEGQRPRRRGEGRLDVPRLLGVDGRDVVGDVGVDGVPQMYQELFRNLPTARPEKHGWLTFIYPSVDLWDGKKML